MHGMLEIDKNRLLIFHELTKRRIYVGELFYDKDHDTFNLVYDDNYLSLPTAIPLGPELDLFKKNHSIKGKLFASLADRIPERSNPAYADYCHSQGISDKETNPIILLGSIGSRGPSSFIFEKTYQHSIAIEDVIKIRKKLKISQHDLAKAFAISEITLQKIESGLSRDDKTLRLLLIYFSFPDVAIWQLYLTGAFLHRDVLLKLFTYFHEMKMQQTKKTKP